jgi:hypothetical protein
MGRKKQLTKRQLAVIDDLLSGELDEQAALDKHKVSRNIYNKWLADEQFSEQLRERITSSHRQSELIVARYAPLAAAKLVELTESQNPETARKACLDIMSLPPAATKKIQATSASERADEQEGQRLSDETVSRLLAVLAEQEGDMK